MKRRSILGSILAWELGGRPHSELIGILRRIARRLRDPSDRLELIYAMVDLGEENFERMITELSDIIMDILRKLSAGELKVLLIYMARACPRCFKSFVKQFRDNIGTSFSRTHFNDIILLVLNIALMNEEAAIFFVNQMSDLIRELAKTEGFKHFGTVLWYMALMGRANTAKSILRTLLDLMLRKSRCLAEFGDLLFWLFKGDEELEWETFKLDEQNRWIPFEC